MSELFRLAMSNIAWDAAADERVAALLRAEGVTAIEVAPTKWRARPLEASAGEIAEYRRRWQDLGLQIVALQALLFGRPDLQLFGDTRGALRDYLRGIIDLGVALGARRLVFGSPKNRVRGSMSQEHAARIAVDFFREVGDHASAHGVVLCIEANPPEYGCDFITTTDEAIALCETINNVGIGINGDLGGMTISGEDPRLTIESAAGALAHFHASEPQLAELGAEADHDSASAGLASIAYPGWVSIEMRSGGNISNVESVGRAVRLAKGWYGPPKQEELNA
jgi:sugar phosphate isomerase/epimerase